MLTVAALLDHLELQVPLVKLELLVNEESPDNLDAPETDHQLPFHPLDAVCALLDHTDPPVHLDHLDPTVNPEHPETLEAMELPATLEALDQLEPPEMLEPLDPLDPPDHLDRPEPSANLDLPDQRDHLDPLDQLDSPETLDPMATALLDPLELPDPLDQQDPMENQDPKDHLDLLALLDPMRSIVLAPAKESETKWRRRCLGDTLEMLSGFSHSPLFFLFFFSLILRMEKM